MSIEPGTRVGGYEIEGPVGKGGMASVYRAIQIGLDRPVALKILSPVLAALDEQYVRRFRQEGVNAAKLDHPNIVPVYQAGEDGGHAYIAMKLIDGHSLKDVLVERGTLPPEDAMPILIDVGWALVYAHALGFVHRDVKPGNILVDRTGHVYLSDFGLSKAIGTSAITSTGQWMGTVEYMPPEQAGMENLDHRADIYSLACVVFECLCGQPPYIGDNHLQLLLAHATAEVPSATLLNPMLPPGVDQVFRRVLAKNPVQRYDTAIDFLEALQAALEERRLTANAEPADAVRRFGPRPRPSAVEPTPPFGPTPAASARRAPSYPPVVEPAPSHAPVTILRCPECFGELAQDDAFCGDCGARISWCRQCSSPIVTGDRFCQHCGASNPG